MKKDIFIDTNIASKFCNPQDNEYKKLIEWLLHFDENDTENVDSYAHLVISRKLIGEYIRSNQNAITDTNIITIIDTLTRQNRLVRVQNDEIKNFRKKHFSKTTEKKLKCNHEDREHIPVVLLSHRKYAISYDDNFIDDVVNFPGFKVLAAKRPEHIPYSE
jgi:hypothetical protein